MRAGRRKPDQLEGFTGAGDALCRTWVMLGSTGKLMLTPALSQSEAAGGERRRQEDPLLSSVHPRQHGRQPVQALANTVAVHIHPRRERADPGTPRPARVAARDTLPLRAGTTFSAPGSAGGRGVEESPRGSGYHQLDDAAKGGSCVLPGTRGRSPSLDLSLSCGADLTCRGV